MKSSRKQPAVTRRAILEAAGRGFARGGLSATGIGAVVADAGLTKGALFHHFADKQSMVLAWVHESLAVEMRQAWSEPLAGVDSLAGLMKLWCGAAEDLEVDDPASVLVAVVAEAGAVNENVGAALRGVMDDWRGTLADVLDRGQRDGWIHRSIQPQVESGILVALFCGLAVAGRCAENGRPGRDSARALEAYLETLRPQ